MGESLWRSRRYKPSHKQCENDPAAQAGGGDNVCGAANPGVRLVTVELSPALLEKGPPPST